MEQSVASFYSKYIALSERYPSRQNLQRIRFDTGGRKATLRRFWRVELTYGH